MEKISGEDMVKTMSYEAQNDCCFSAWFPRVNAQPGV